MLLCIVIPNTALGMKIDIADNFNKKITLEFKLNYHAPGHEVYHLIENTIDLVKVIVAKLK